MIKKVKIAGYTIRDVNSVSIMGNEITLKVRFERHDMIVVGKNKRFLEKVFGQMGWPIGKKEPKQ